MVAHTLDPGLRVIFKNKLAWTSTQPKVVSNYPPASVSQAQDYRWIIYDLAVKCIFINIF